MNTLLNELVEKGVFCHLKGEKLVFSGNLDALDERLKAAIKENKIQLVELLQVKNANSSAGGTIKRVQETGNIPLSFAQNRLWLLDQIEGRTHQYNILINLQLKGRLDIQALTQAFNIIIERHEILRTSYHKNSNNEPFQQVNPVDNQCFKFHWIDLKDKMLAEQEVAIQNYLRKQSFEPFHLEADRMIRAAILTLATESYSLIITLHHIASDGWSRNLLTQELTALYNAYTKGAPNPLKPLALQYSDYAHWQHQHLDETRRNQYLQYWKDKLAFLPEVNSLPIDFTRSSTQDFSGATFQQKIARRVFDGIKMLERQQNVSLFMILNAAFSVLLSRYSNTHDIVFGTPVANRQQHEIAELVGFFVNNLVVRIDTSGNPVFLKLLQQCKTDLLDMYEHQQLPFDLLVSELQPTRSRSRSPLFQIMLVLQNNEAANLNLVGLELQQGKKNDYVAKYDLTLTVTEGDADNPSLFLEWNYATGLFKASTIKQLAASFACILRGIVDNPEMRIESLPVLTEDMVHDLVKFNDNDVSSEELPVHVMFEKVADEEPDKIAIIERQPDGSERTLTYRQLNAKANQIANCLISDYVTPGLPVGLYCRRSADALVGLLAILKYGSCYVPLDKDHPQSRIHQIVQDSGIKLVIGQSDLLEDLNELECEKLAIDNHSRFANSSEDSPRHSDIDTMLESLAYVLFTSGSTGKPKGVMVSHRSLSNYVNYARNAYLNTDIETAVFSSPLAFDATITTTLLPLTAGIAVDIVPENDVIQHLRQRLFDTNRCTLFKLTPSHLNALKSANELTSNLKHVLVIGGEQLSVAALSPWLGSRLPMALMVNEYGPTETVVGCSTWFGNAASIASLSDKTNVPIGRPINNTKLYVLNEALSFSPPGVAGELFIGGVGVAKGYINNETLTSSHFVEITLPVGPDGQLQSQRLYKTGDSVRILLSDDGRPNVLEFLGRNDSQIKLRGFRIETSEIEAQIVQSGVASQAKVILHKDFDDDTRSQLVAYFIPSQLDGAASKEDGIYGIHQYLKGTLPEYMVPSKCIALESFPLTQNGKLDIGALPELSTVPVAVYKAPQTDLEVTLSHMWQSILMVDRVSITDSFFDLGGNSLLSIKLADMIEVQLQKTVKVSDLFENQTIEDQAQFITQLQDSGSKGAISLKDSAELNMITEEFEI